MRIAWRFEVNVDLATVGEPAAMAGSHVGQCGLKCVNGVPVKKFHGYIEIRWLAKPIVEQLKGAAIYIARTQDNVPITDQMA